MRKTLLFLVSLAAAAAARAEVRLIPYPRSLEARGGKLALPSPVSIGVRSQAAEDRFAAGLLAGEIRSIARREAAIGAAAPRGIVIGRAGDAAIDAEIARRKLDRAALANPEGYLLDVARDGVLLAARTGAGIFYGVQTLRQLARPGAGRTLELPLLTVADWPALAVRGLMIDTSQGAVLSPEMLRTAVRTAAEYKLNLVNLYVEHVFPFTHSPLTAEGAALGFDEMKELAAYARRHHVELVPQQQTFGHLHSLLRWELYSGMAETTRGDVLAVGDEGSYQWAFQAAKQLAAVFPGSYLHIGGDETFELGRGRSRELVARRGIGQVYAEHMRRMEAQLRPLGRKLIFWGDIAQKNPEAIPALPKNLIAATWTYIPDADFAPFIAPFRDAGFEVWVSPGVHNWRRIFPNFTMAAANINGFVEAGKKLGATGMLNTHWNDHGEEFFNLAWYGIVYGAAAAWQPGPVDNRAFDAAFDWAFYRNDGAVFATVIRRLEGVNGLLQARGFPEADNSLAWIEPFSPAGSGKVRRLLPAASEIRRRAEESMVDLQAHAGDARLHAGTLPFLRFAARRLDTLGLKVQLSKDIADYYRAARANAADQQRMRQNLREITGRSGVGRAQDILDATAELKTMLRALWPEENRPYYLESLLVRYDAELQYWHRTRRLFADVLENAAAEPPAPESLGLYLP